MLAPDQIVTVREAARLTGRSEQDLYRMVLDGKLVGYRLDRVVHVSLAEVEELP